MPRAHRVHTAMVTMAYSCTIILSEQMNIPYDVCTLDLDLALGLGACSESLHLLLRHNRISSATDFGRQQLVFKRFARFVIHHVARLSNSWLHAWQPPDLHAALPIAFDCKPSLFQALLDSAALPTADCTAHRHRLHHLLSRDRVAVLKAAQRACALAEGVPTEVTIFWL